MFWFNPSETFVDINDVKPEKHVYKQSHWMSETGLVDLFLFSGVDMLTAAGATNHSPVTISSSTHLSTRKGLDNIYYDYSLLTGFTAIPPIFALGYHQCRWNYRDEKDVATVESTFEELDYPLDVIWLDIEHTDGKRYFTWDKNLFPTPVEMQQAVSAHGRKMVTIVDPHIKRDDGYE